MQDSQAIDEPYGRDLPADSLFGVCHAVGEDLGFDPFILRVALLSTMFFNPLVTVGAYVALAAAVGVSRWLFPSAKSDESAAQLSLAAVESSLEPELESREVALAA